MDYNKIIDEIFNETSKNIIKKFKADNELGRSFIKSIDGVINFIVETKNNSIIYKNYDLFNNSIYYFKNCLDHYKKEVAISNIIEIDIKKDFVERIKKRNIIDLNNNEIPDYSFDQFISDLLVFDTLNKIENRLRKNSDLYKLFYENNDYTDFTLEAFDDHVVNSNLYREVFAKFHPEKNIPKAIKRIDQFENEIYEIIIDNTDQILTTAPEQSEKKSCTDIFEVDEQALVLFLCLADKNNIPLTEKLKLHIIIGEIKDKSMLQGSSANNNFYQKVNKGINRKGSKSSMVDIIDSLLIKIDGFDLNITNQTLKKHRRTLVSEQKEAKKT